MNKITLEARHRRSREELLNQLIANQSEIARLAEVRRKLHLALRMLDECSVLTVSDQGDIEFHLKNDG